MRLRKRADARRLGPAEVDEVDRVARDEGSGGQPLPGDAVLAAVHLLLFVPTLPGVFVRNERALIAARHRSDADVRWADLLARPSHAVLAAVERRAVVGEELG